MRVTREQYLTLTEVADHLGRPQRTVEQWVRRGQLVPASRGGLAGEPGQASRFALSAAVECDRQRRPRRWHELLDAAAARWQERSS